MDNNFLT